MIKLDRKKRKPKKDDDEEEKERTEVDFTSDALVGTVEARHIEGGLEIRKKADGENTVRKGPAMPSPQVLAMLQKEAENFIPEVLKEAEKERNKNEQKSENDSKPEIKNDSKAEAEKPENSETEKSEKIPEPEITEKPEDAFKVPEFAVPKTEEKVTPKSTGEIPKKNSIPAPAFAYREPQWTGICEDESYKLEVLKGGKIIGEYGLSGKSCHVLGKLESCNLRLEHPSISRYHAILQWHAQDKTWKLMDYGSSNGVKMNKVRLKAHQYVRAVVGSVLEFGSSTRKYLLSGPSEDQLEESKESGFELREQFKKKQKKLEKAMMGEEDSDEEEKKEDENGVTWGFAEDAWEDDDKDDDLLPDASKKANFLKSDLDPNAFYHKDPLKAINHFFTSDNMEPPWVLKQTPKGKWECSLELPIGDGHNGIIVEAEGDGKIGAKTYCALEACKALDRHGMFDENVKARRKANKLEENDFYDSDEDSFFDRTGDLDAKREKRRKALRKRPEKIKALSHEEITGKLTEVQKELEKLEKQMDKDKKIRSLTKASDDPLDAFMKQVKAGNMLDSMTRSKMHRRKAELTLELQKLEKLAKLAAPASLPDQLKPTSAKEAEKAKRDLMNRIRSKKKGFGVTGPVKTQMPQVVKNQSSDLVENDSDEEDKPKPEPVAKTIKLFDKTEKSPKPEPSKPEKMPEPVKKLKTPESSPKEQKNTEKSKPEEKMSEAQKAKAALENSRKRKKATFQPTIMPGLVNDYREDYAINPESDQTEDQLRKKKKTNENKISKASKNFDSDYTESREYSTWVPPENQSGDGLTDLNKKLGY